MNTFVTYEGLPINSGGAHSFGKKPIRGIYSDTLKFLRSFTNSDEPKHFDITLYNSQGGLYKTLPIVWDLFKKFGIPAYGLWNFRPTKQHFYTWSLKYPNLDKALSTLEEYANLPQNEYGPLVLSAKWEFHFIQPNTKKAFEGQEKIPIIDDRNHNSQLYLRLGQKSTISVWFAFPFDILGEVEINYLRELKSNLPFKPSDKHWRVWSKSNAGNWTPKVLDLKI